MDFPLIFNILYCYDFIHYDNFQLIFLLDLVNGFLIIWRYNMKRIIGLGLVLILLIVGISFFINHPINTTIDTNASQQSVEYTENGITLSIPGDWVSAKSGSNSTVLAVADPDAKDTHGFKCVNVNIEKKTNAGSLESEFNSNYNTLARNSNFNILFEGNATFNNQPAMEADYTESSSGTLKRHKAIWVKKDSDIYLILCSAPEVDFDNRLNTFDFIINSVQL